MEEAKPLLTLTKSRLIEPTPSLSSQSQSLLETLNGLCSFYSSADLASFLFSDIFSELAGQGSTWIVFEAGVYLDHTKTVEIMLKDSEILTIYSDQVFPSSNQDDFTQIIQDWHDDVMEI